MKKSNKLILIITGSRGDYDILKSIIKKTKESKKLKIKTIATGSHLIKTYSNLKIFDKDKIKSYRRLTVRECARVQDFPDDYHFIYDKIIHGYKMVGNAVPVNLAKVVAKKIMEDLKK